MFDRINEINDRIHASFDRLAAFPLAFVVLLGLFVVASIVLERDIGDIAARKLLQLPG